MTSPISSSKINLERKSEEIDIQQKTSVKISTFTRDNDLWNEVSIKIGKETVHIEAQFKSKQESAEIEFCDFPEGKLIKKFQSNECIFFIPFNEDYPKPNDFLSFESLALTILGKEQPKLLIFPVDQFSHPFFSLTLNIRTEKKITEHRTRIVATDEAIFFLNARELDRNFSKEKIHFLNSFKVD